MSGKLYRYNTDCVEVEIKKPMYGSFVCIRDTHIKYARQRNLPLKITIPQGVFTLSVEEFMDGAKKIEKVFLIPDRPMVLWGNYAMRGVKADA